MGKHKRVDPPLPPPKWFESLCNQVGFLTLMGLASFGLITLMLEISGV